VPVYRLSATAEEDIIHLLAYTQDRFGEAARQRYEALLVASLNASVASRGLSLGTRCAAFICATAGTMPEPLTAGYIDLGICCFIA
jgi:plasmid stabilization system protein ParE